MHAAHHAELLIPTRIAAPSRRQRAVLRLQREQHVAEGVVAEKRLSLLHLVRVARLVKVAELADPLLQLVFDSLTDPQRAGADGSHCLHYLARDLLTLVCAWPADALQLAADPTAATLVSDLLECLFKLCQDENSQLLRENVRIVKGVLERWGAQLSVRRRMILTFLKFTKPKNEDWRTVKENEKREIRAKTTGLHLLNAIVANDLSFADDASQAVGMAGRPYARVRAEEMLDAVLAIAIDERKKDKKAQPPRKTLYVPAAQLLGQMLAQAHEKREGAAAQGELQRLGKHLSGRMSPTEEDTRVLCQLLDSISEYFPAVLLLPSNVGLTFGQHCATQLTHHRRRRKH